MRVLDVLDDLSILVIANERGIIVVSANVPVNVFPIAVNHSFA